jgi:hypothetical protein
MFTVDEPTAEAIRRAVEAGGELAGVVELRRHFPLITENANARRCVRVIAGWTPPDDPARNTGEDEAPGRSAAHRRAARKSCKTGVRPELRQFRLRRGNALPSRSRRPLPRSRYY